MTAWTSQFDELAALDDGDRAFLEAEARVVQLAAGTRVFAPGKHPDAFLLVLDGTVRVQQVGANGREIVLYRVSGGESCILTTACLLSDEDYLAEGVAESQVTAVALARTAFEDLMARSAAFRRLVFTRYASRMTRLMALVEDVAFERLGNRLARKLIELSGDGDTLAITHQALAVELGSAREVVSRQLKEFAARGLVKVTRGHVELLDRDALARFEDA